MGRSKRNQIGCALVHFNRFLDDPAMRQVIAARRWEQLTVDEATPDVFEQFVTFLIERSPSIRKWETASAYVAQMRDALAQRFKADNPELAILDDKWYKAVRSTVKKAFVERANVTGSAFIDRAPALQKEGVQQVGHALFLEMGEPATSAAAAHDRFLIAFQWAILGRASDAALMRKSDLQWDAGSGAALAGVSRQKTTNEAPLLIYCDRNDYRADMFHALGSLVATVSDQSQELFPRIRGTSSASAYLNRMFDTLVDRYEHLVSVSPSLGDLGGHVHRRTRSHSLRRGATTAAAAADGVTLSSIIYRGGWNLESMCTALEYIVGGGAGDARVGRVLAGWPSGSGGQPMSFAFVKDNTHEKARVDAWVRAVFGSNWHLWSRTSPGLLTVCAASMLMYLPQTLKGAGDSLEQPVHPLHKTMSRACDEIGLPRSTLMGWSGEILVEFLKANITAIPGSMLRDAQPEVAARLTVDVFSLTDTVERLCHTVLQLHDTVLDLQRENRQQALAMAQTQSQIMEVLMSGRPPAEAESTSDIAAGRGPARSSPDGPERELRHPAAERTLDDAVPKLTDMSVKTAFHAWHAAGLKTLRYDAARVKSQLKQLVEEYCPLFLDPDDDVEAQNGETEAAYDRRIHDMAAKVESRIIRFLGDWYRPHVARTTNSTRKPRKLTRTAVRGTLNELRNACKGLSKEDVAAKLSLLN
ncbi:Core-binding (CB) domain-containing protein [Plasmodiophora brassicae]|uniref:Core-binding (CB) domain-containing protein n=1 Tax=Plasmodiophora brassicae TaxID=37360 RepID=A0A0G4IL39_PLABS|nr:hypothetical protein PBRA_009687 [Plasmodiophora brassicae]